MNRNVINNYAELLALNLIWYTQIKCEMQPIRCNPRFIKHVTVRIQFEPNYAIVRMKLKPSIKNVFPETDQLAQHIDIEKLVLIAPKAAITPKEDYYLHILYVKNVTDAPYTVYVDMCPMSFEYSSMFIPFETLRARTKAATDRAKAFGLSHSPMFRKYEPIVRTIIIHPDIALPTHLSFLGSNPHGGYDIRIFELVQW